MRFWLLVAVLAALPVLAKEGDSLRGKLVNNAAVPVLETADGRKVPLDGDADTLGVLRDARLAGAAMELRGTMQPSGKFRVNPIHERAMHVHKEGKRLLVTYWCDVCAIRTYTPSKCWCCQEETELDLRETIE
ncbi:MAG: hypothetical protein IPM24_03015 [Bryobacterales bacterium]|nr:hypothetical protein [Bryobacterales bacterium]